MAAPRAEGAAGQICFVLECAATRPGEHVKVVGSLPALGKWDPQGSRAVLQTSADDWPVWRSDPLQVPADVRDFEYKYVICGGADVRWEGRCNRQMRPPAAGSRATMREAFDRMDAAVRTEEAWPPAPTKALPPAAVAQPPFTPPPRAVTFQAPAAAPPTPTSPLQPEPEPAPNCSRAADVPGDGEPPALRLSKKVRAKTEVIPQTRVEVPPSDEDDNTAHDKQADGGGGAHGRMMAVRTSPARTVLRKARTVTFSTDGDDVSPVSRPKIIKRRITVCLSDLGGLAPTARELRRLSGESHDAEEGLVREAPIFELHGLWQPPPAPSKRTPTGNKRRSAGKTAEEEEAELTLPGMARGESESSTDAPSRPSDRDDEEDDENHDDDAHPHDQEDDDIITGVVEVGDGAKFDSLYTVEDKTLGRGGFGAVFRCLPRDGGEARAVKVMDKTRLSARDLAMLFGDGDQDGEVTIHKSLPRHRYIVAVHGFFDEPACARLVLDICTGGDLFDEIMRVSRGGGAVPNAATKGLSEPAAATVLAQLLAALSFLHHQGVVHRDVKAENVLVVHPTSAVPLEDPAAVVRLCDFGFAARCQPGSSGLMDRCGSPDYVAPEVLDGRGYGCKVDVWSAGVVLFACLRADMPFAAPTDKEVLMRVRRAHYTLDDGWNNTSQESQELVRALMQREAALRPDATEAHAHRWLASAAASAHPHH